MAYTQGFRSAAEIAAYNAGKPYLAVTNALRNRIQSIEWSSSGLWSNSGPSGGANITDANWPTDVLYSDFTYMPTQPSSAAAALYEIFLMLRLTPGTGEAQTIDSLMIQPLNFDIAGNGGQMVANLDIAHDGEFSSSLDENGNTQGTYQRIATASNWNRNTKIIRGDLGLAGTKRRYQNLEYARVRIATSNLAGFGSTLPQIGAVQLSHLRQLAHLPMRPVDPAMEETAVDQFIAESGLEIDNILYERKQLYELNLTPTATNSFALDEADSINKFWTDGAHRRPFLVVDEPLGGVGGFGTGMWMKYSGKVRTKNMPYVGPVERRFASLFREQPPLRSELG